MTQDMAQQPYHRLFRTLVGYRWWRPLVALLLAIVYYVVFSIVVAVPLVVLAMFTGEISLTDPGQAQAQLESLAIIDAASPVSLLLALLDRVKEECEVGLGVCVHAGEFYELG
ncbi:MAG: hypothetical protein ABL886_13335, partial [Rhodoglobus sp.]